ncbi:aldehyde dehydrogenase family protein [Gammaproteobacteria bacterium 42_54_T18]|nr:aldehyde dehydrogenase family protein [Gammaproteobacteria bacterium 42_54_T18]
MKNYTKVYINGDWITPHGTGIQDVINPFTEELALCVPRCDLVDVDNAVAAAKEAFKTWSQTSAQYRSDLIDAIVAKMEERKEDLCQAAHITMGCPAHLSGVIHVDGPIHGMSTYAKRAFLMEAEEEIGHSLVVKEAIGVCAVINPWNYPLHQLVGKLAPALAAGCTVVAKPAGQTPLQDLIMAEILDEVGVPAGVFNVITGSGATLGPALSSHPDVDMVSFTGSNQAGIQIAKEAAPTIKRVTQELGGKSPLIITADANLEEAMTFAIQDVMINTGQTCTALSRMLVPHSIYDEAVATAIAVLEHFPVGDNEECMIGPMASLSQKNTVLDFIATGIEEGATLVAGGTDMPAGIDKGFYVQPTIFANVNNQMTIAREEIFGPVLCVIPYNDIDEAIDIANDTPYGLSSGVFAKDRDSGLKIARRIRAGLCFVNGAEFNYEAPFGGYKQSGNGREFGDEGLAEFVEVKSIQL